MSSQAALLMPLVTTTQPFRPTSMRSPRTGDMATWCRLLERRGPLAGSVGGCLVTGPSIAGGWHERVVCSSMRATTVDGVGWCSTMR